MKKQISEMALAWATLSMTTAHDVDGLHKISRFCAGYGAEPKLKIAVKAIRKAEVLGRTIVSSHTFLQLERASVNFVRLQELGKPSAFGNNDREDRWVDQMEEALDWLNNAISNVVKESKMLSVENGR